MLNNNLNILKIKDTKDLGLKTFFCGTFFLSSALPISIIFFLISIIISIKINKRLFFKDKYNLALLVSIVLITFSNLNSIANIDSSFNTKASDILLGLINWIPYFILFFTSQNYLNTFKNRRIFAKLIIASTLPVIFSCILQAWFKIYGPFDLFNLIVWFQKQPKDNEISGLFSNQNYTGLWLSSILPFALCELKMIKNIFYQKLIMINIILAIIYFIILTLSRNAILGMIIIFMSIIKRKFFYLVSLISSLILIFNVVYLFFNDKLFDLLNNFNRINFPRLEIYKISTKLILDHPILGWGSSTFPENFKLNGGYHNPQHTHNMLIELAYNHGLPLAFLMVVFVTFIIFYSWKIINNQTYDRKLYLNNKCWLISFIVIVISHLSDITYYDGKISILTWILMAGLRCINEEDHKINENKVPY